MHGYHGDVFGGRADPNNSAYDNHFITDEEFGVALPDRVTANPRPKVRVTHSQTRRSVICDIVDVGPWNIDDPYWERGARPQAETGTDMMGRRTTPPASTSRPPRRRRSASPARARWNGSL